jgi:hypothetical protein
MEVSGQLCASVALSPAKNLRYLLDVKLSGLRVWLDVKAKKKFLLSPGIKTHRPICSHSKYYLVLTRRNEIEEHIVFPKLHI